MSAFMILDFKQHFGLSRSSEERIFRALELGLKDAFVEALKTAGLATINKFGFAHGQPGQKIDDEEFRLFLTNQLGTEPNIGVVAAAKNLLFEAHVFITASLKNRLEVTSDAVKPVPLAERSSRLQALRLKYPGLDISKSMEPGHALLDAMVHQAETKQLRYVPPSHCPSREQELSSNKSANKTLEVDGSNIKLKEIDKSIFVENNTEFLLYQAMRRRGLALEFADLITFTVHQKWVDFLFAKMTKEPVRGFQKVQIFQVLRADKAAWVHMADTCTDIRPGTGARPLDAIMSTLPGVHTVVFNLLPLQAPPWASSGDARKGKGKDIGARWTNGGKGKDQPGSWQRWTPYDRFAGGGGKTSKGGKGAGKGKYQKGSWERRPNMPRLLMGLHYKNTDGRPLCFAWNLPGGCAKGKDGGGLHLCSKCLGAHSYNECPQKGPN